MEKIPGEDLDIDRKRRVNLPRQKLDLRPTGERIGDFQEVVVPFDIERARFEASRCIHCPAPEGCVSACPVQNDIPSALWLIEQGDFIKAAMIYRQTSTLPEICGRICPHEILCEGGCVLSKEGEPVWCGFLEVFCVDYQRVHGPVEKEKAAPKDNRVAIVGGGPGGLACAERLVEQGYSVTVFDYRPLAGGLLLYGIPGFKLSSKILLDKLKELSQWGVEFVNNICIGEDKSIEDLFNEGFEAIFIAAGTGVDIKMGIPGEEIPGVLSGIDYLIRSNVDNTLLPPNLAQELDLGDKVVIIGGGDTASDCLRTTVRLGVKNVTCLYRRSEMEMPGTTKDRGLAREEGAKYMFLTQPIAFIAGEDGRLSKVECVKMELGQPDEKGRRRPIPIEGSNFFIEADNAIQALGFSPDPTLGKNTNDLETTRRGLIVVDPVTCATSREGIYAGGDIARGADLVVTAVADGIAAATSIDAYLQGKAE